MSRTAWIERQGVLAATAAVPVVEAGRTQYARYCAACHGDNGQTRGATFPNLTVTPLAAHAGRLR